MERITVGIVGNGVVGSALARAYDRPPRVTVKVYDKEANKSVNPLHEVLECNVVFLCLPTPTMAGTGGLNVSALEEFCETHKGYRKLFAIKSTVPIGTTRRLAAQYDLPNLVHCPEFLTARTAVLDAFCPKAFVIGTPKIRFGAAVKMDCIEPLINLYKICHNPSRYDMDRLDAAMSRSTTCHFMVRTSEETELTKLALNAFYAVKVAFFNELHDLVEKTENVDFDRVVYTMWRAGMLEKTHTQVPGPDGLYGFGGACLPKDVDQFIREHMKAGSDSILTAGAIVRNVIDRYRKRETTGSSPVEASPTREVYQGGEGS